MTRLRWMISAAVKDFKIKDLYQCQKYCVSNHEQASSSLDYILDMFTCVKLFWEDTESE